MTEPAFHAPTGTHEKRDTLLSRGVPARVRAAWRGLPEASCHG
ncbi:MAG: hypothetical protein ACYDBQ_05095 [Thermoplasmatota archaeon]